MNDSTMAEDVAADLVVVGLGPAGRALSHRASAAGVDVVAIDPHPNRRWTPTYSAWSDELPHWLPATAVASTIARPAAWTVRRHTIDRTYCVLDTTALQQVLSEGSARVLQGTATSVTKDAVRLADGRTVTGRTIVDARGSAGVVGLAEQTAYGIVVDRSAGVALLEDTSAWFMDWRYDNGTSPEEVPSFLYAVPLDDDRILLEETCLVGSPPLGLDVLRDRLAKRLHNRGARPTGNEPIERVRFPVQPPGHLQGERGAVRFGARSSLMHPATGYSVAASLAAADDVVAMLRTGNSVRPLSIWAVQRLRNLGLRTALNLEPELIPHFFASFFELPVAQQTAYLSNRADPVATMSAMMRMFPTLPPRARMAIARTVVNPRRGNGHNSSPR